MKFIKLLIKKLLDCFDKTRPIVETMGNQTPCKPTFFFTQKLLRINSHCYWPAHFTSKISSPEKIYAGIDVSPGYMPGCYIYGTAGIYIGDYTQIGPNVGIISGNHDVYDSRKTVDNQSPVVIGDYCWIGMNAVILPNVVIGHHTVVAAGAIVTKSHSEGHCVLAGNPAKVIKRLSKEEVIKFKNDKEYNGYIKSDEFERFRVLNLKISSYSEVKKEFLE